MAFTVKKRYKRICIVDDQTDAIVYAAPNWITVPNRQPYYDLAAKFNELGRRDIGAIVEFETVNYKVKTPRNEKRK